MKRLLCPVLLTSLALAQALAQDLSRVTRIIEIKHADVNHIAAVMGPFGAGVSPNPQMKVITVNGPTAVVAAIEEAVKKLDVPPQPLPNIELTAYLVVASAQPPGGSPIPADLQPVVNQLKGVLQYQGFRVLDTLLMRTAQGSSAEARGLTSNGGVEGQRPGYHLNIGKAQIISDGPNRTLRLTGMSLNMRIPNAVKGGGPLGGVSQIQYHDANIKADVDIREGQKVVVGKTSFDTPDTALILILMARVVN